MMVIRGIHNYYILITIITMSVHNLHGYCGNTGGLKVHMSVM